jgi:hypothetical protein
VIVRCVAIFAIRRNCFPSLFVLSLGGVVSELSCEAIVRFVDIGSHVIVDRHCLYFLWGEWSVS